MMAFTASRASCKVNCSNSFLFLVIDQAAVSGLLGPCSLHPASHPSYPRVSQALTVFPQHIPTVIFNKCDNHVFFGIVSCCDGSVRLLFIDTGRA
jgi:hypothetical protein